MKIRIVVTVATAAATMALGVPAAHAADWKACGSVSFSGGDLSSTNYGAKNIRALRTGCATAKSVALDAENGRDRQFRSHGFSCVGHAADEVYSDYVCIKTKVDRKGLHDKVRFTTIGLG